MNILALSPHTDDIELNAGASIARWTEEGHCIDIVAFSKGNDLSGAHRHEFESSMKILGVRKYKLMDFECRTLEKSRQQIIDYLLANYIRVDKYEVILCPASWDYHQDHKTVYDVTMNLFMFMIGRNNVSKTADLRVLGYSSFRNQCQEGMLKYFNCVSFWHLSKKMSAIESYKTQKDRKYTSEKVVMGVAQVTGSMCGCEYAEGFELIRDIRI